jgi:hypothetical protein
VVGILVAGQFPDAGDDIGLFHAKTLADDVDADAGHAMAFVDPFIGKHGERFAVDQYAVAIEDDKL